MVWVGSAPSLNNLDIREPLFNEVFGITNDFLYPSNSKTHEKEPQYKETSL